MPIGIEIEYIILSYEYKNNAIKNKTYLKIIVVLRLDTA